LAQDDLRKTTLDVVWEQTLMEEMELQQEQSGVFTRIKGWFGREREDGFYEEEVDVVEQQKQTPTYRLHTTRSYNITVRRTVQSFQDAVAAADGLKKGEQQILNLTQCDDNLREKIKDFMCGVNYAHEATWEELGEQIFLLAPPHAFVEVAPATPRMAAAKN